MKLNRLTRYYYLRFIRLRGEPPELALGMAFGIFSGMMPIIPFHMAFSVLLALVFKGSKITAALGTWVSNPLNWYFLYYYNYKIGASIIGLSENNRVFSSVMGSIQRGEGALDIIGKILGAGGAMVAAFLLGGLIMAFIVAPLSYFIFLKLFQFIRDWRRKRKDLDVWEAQKE